METLQTILIGIIWIIFAVIDVMEIMPWAYHDPQWYNVSLAIILTIGLVGATILVESFSVKYNDPYYTE